ncbi:DUF922 domain-containing Zn-dependent protease [Rhodobium gokarnense]|uniref:Secreted Zn-dependent protease n=1 Tax=Rhodobium gokarnense TaxID=364296 RepID=A0ABT3H5X0_9HYPH|nr:DUF922 domain-containing Zn-dependent protease [Rhodobium gokarnense]MCW2305782.1 putative secreted Zn-dependent protease [Rhodobium gokarnense]
MPAGAAPVAGKTVYKHYAVRGETPAEIIVDIWRQRRVNRGDFSIASIQTSVEPSGHLQSGKTCRVKDFSVKTTYVVTLPRHVGERRLKPRTRRLYRSFVKNARQHELTHRAIYQKCMQRFVRSVRQMTPQRSCAAARRVITRIAKLESLRCRAENLAFDKREYAKSARLPLLRQALADTEALKAARLSTGRINVFAGDAGAFSSSAVLLRRHNRAMENK